MAESTSTEPTKVAKTTKKTTKKKTARKTAKKATTRKATTVKKTATRAASTRKINAPVKAAMPATTRPAPPATRLDLQRMVAEAAYYRALNRGFRGGNPEDDWRAAEAEIDALLSGAPASE